MRCLIVDDSADFVDAARGLLECQGITVVGVASTSAEALRLFEELRPDVTLVDIDLGRRERLRTRRATSPGWGGGAVTGDTDLHPRRPGLRGHDRDQPGRRVPIQVRPDVRRHPRSRRRVSKPRGR